jgi:hypothetical protein
MTLAPEAVLLAELGIPLAAVAVAHKLSVPPPTDSAQAMNEAMHQVRAPCPLTLLPLPLLHVVTVLSSPHHLLHPGVSVFVLTC